MPPTLDRSNKAPAQCPPGSGCVNLERLKGDMRAGLERVNNQVAKHVHQAVTEIKVQGTKLEDVRRELSALPRDIAAAIRREREDAGERFEQGRDNFKKLFDRQDDLFNITARIEKRMAVMWVLIVVIGLGSAVKMVAALAPLIIGLFT